MTDVPPDAVYRCDGCGRVFPDDQIAYERRLAADHDRLCDTLPVLLAEQSLNG